MAQSITCEDKLLVLTENYSLLDQVPFLFPMACLMEILKLFFYHIF